MNEQTREILTEIMGSKRLWPTTRGIGPRGRKFFWDQNTKTKTKRNKPRNPF